MFVGVRFRGAVVAWLLTVFGCFVGLFVDVFGCFAVDCLVLRSGFGGCMLLLFVLRLCFAADWLCGLV